MVDLGELQRREFSWPMILLMALLGLWLVWHMAKDLIEMARWAMARHGGQGALHEPFVARPVRPPDPAPEPPVWDA
eukprot:950618-Alexandrium_andersonii.AAC.1